MNDFLDLNNGGGVVEVVVDDADSDDLIEDEGIK